MKSHLSPTPHSCAEMRGSKERKGEEGELKIMPGPRLTKERFEDLLGEFTATSRVEQDLARPQTLHK